MIALALKGTVILAAAFCAAATLRRRSAALRHFLWTAALAAILILPVATLAPQPAPIAAPAIFVTAVTDAAPAAVRTSPIPWLAILYGIGAALAASRFVAGAWRTSRMARRGTQSAIGDDFGVHAVLSNETAMPLAWGIFRRIVLLPADTEAWPADRLRSVLLHEAAHHRRADLPAQAIGQAACCLYWFHPLAWLALARQRDERERACDDAVLRQGIRAHDYASHLLEVARAIAASRQCWSDAPAMAEASSLETRVRGVLDGEARRGPLTRAAAAGVVAALVALVAPLTVVSLRAQAPNSISGVVEDPSGARVPKARVTAKNLEGKNIEATVADMAGEYHFTNLPPGRYEIDVVSPGFKRATLSTTLVSGAAARADAHLDLGEASETVSVVGRRTPAPAPQSTAAPRRIPVGGNVQPMRLIKQTRPVYPPELQQAGVDGTVVVRAVVSKTGVVLNPQVVSSTDPRLNQAALDAVMQWQFQPTLLNGQPVETATTISVRFDLEQ